MTWVEKYKPVTLQEIQGRDTLLLQLKKCILEKKPVLLHGPCGVGKTSSVYALAQDLDYEIIEVNASDQRNKDAILSVIGNSAQQMSLFSRGKIVLVDEVDGIAGNDDRGGVQALVSILQTPTHALVFTANDIFDKKLSSLKSKCTLLEFAPLDYLSIFVVLKRILDTEKITYEESVLKDFARRSGGDLRASIQDLETLCAGRTSLVELESVSDREKKESVFYALQLIFHSLCPEKVNDVFSQTNVDLDEAHLWIDENIPLVYQKPHDLFRAYYALSKASVFKGRILRWQYWRFLVYQQVFLTVGIALAKDEKYKGVYQFKRSTRPLKIWWANQKTMKRKAIAEKVGIKTHCSKKKALASYIPLLQQLAKKGSLLEGLELDDDEITWLKKP